MHRVTTKLAFLATLVTGTLMVSACTPTVQVAAPQEPITINLNVKIEHEIYIRVARELDELFSESSGLF